MGEDVQGVSGERQRCHSDFCQLAEGALSKGKFPPAAALS